jgi:Fe-S cluster assembly ATP-binding protein
MGPNGSGKSTLASVLLGHPAYEVSKKSKVLLDGKNILSLSTDKRAVAGMFLAFQSPIAIAGVSVMNLLRTSLQTRDKNVRSSKVQSPVLAQRFQVGAMSMIEFGQMLKTYAKKLNLDEALLQRGIHDGFSGGEKKKIEMLQALVLKPRFAIFDEIDTGLDVDALKAVSYGIAELQKSGVGIIIITHYQRILKYVKPDFVHILVAGNIVKTGNAALAKEIEASGYGKYI